MAGAATALRSCMRLWSPIPALRALVNDGARSERALTGVRALALLHVLAEHSVVLLALRGLDLAAAAAGSSGGGSAEAAASRSFLTSLAAQPLLTGDVGVDAFFTLSGYLIALMWLKEVQRCSGRFDYPRFMARRFLRIWPAMALALGAWWGVCRALRNGSGLMAALDAECRGNWWAILTFTQNFSPAYCLGQTWSVATEMQMYLVTPFVMLAAYSPAAGAPRRFGLALLAALSLVGVAINAAVYAAQGPDGLTSFVKTPNPWTYTSPFTRSPPYFAGMCACVVVDVERKRRRSSSSSSTSTSTSSSSSSNSSSGRLAAAPQLHAAGAPEKDAAAIIVVKPPSPPSGGAAVGAVLTPPPGINATCAPGATRACAREGLLVLAVDAAAVAVLAALLFTGAGQSALTNLVAPGLEAALRVAGRWLFGWALARVFVAVLLGRLRAVNAVLTLRALVPVATLSYSAYLLQLFPLTFLPSWCDTGVVTAYAAWAAALLGFALTATISLALALPSFVLVERPFSLVLPPRRARGGDARDGGGCGRVCLPSVR